jgi:hypothetical protein
VQPPIDFEAVGDIEVIPTGGEGDQFAIDDLVGVPIVITGAKFDKGRSGRLAGKDIATIQFAKKDGGPKGSSPPGAWPLCSPI